MRSQADLGGTLYLSKDKRVDVLEVPPVTLRVGDMQAELALQFVSKLTGVPVASTRAWRRSA